MRNLTQSSSASVFFQWEEKVDLKKKWTVYFWPTFYFLPRRTVKFIFICQYLATLPYLTTSVTLQIRTQVVWIVSHGSSSCASLHCCPLFSAIVFVSSLSFAKSENRYQILNSGIRCYTQQSDQFQIINSLLQRESNYGGSCTVGDGECPCNLFKPEAALPRAKAADNHCVDNSEARIHRRLRKIFYAKPRSYFLKKRAFPGLFFFIFVFAGLQLTDNYIQIQIYHCRCWDSNHGFLVSEATALPTAPQPRPFPDHTCSGSWSHQKRPRSILQSPQLTAAFAYSKNSCCLFGLNFNKFLWIH